MIIEQGKRKGIETILKENHWTHAITKPAVGSFGNDVLKLQLNFSSSMQQEKHLKNLVDQCDMLVQPFISSVKIKGNLFFFSRLFYFLFVYSFNIMCSYRFIFFKKFFVYLFVGEISLIYINNQFIHAVNKVPPQGKN